MNRMNGGEGVTCPMGYLASSHLNLTQVIHSWIQIRIELLADRKNGWRCCCWYFLLSLWGHFDFCHQQWNISTFRNTNFIVNYCSIGQFRRIAEATRKSNDSRVNYTRCMGIVSMELISSWTSEFWLDFSEPDSKTFVTHGWPVLFIVIWNIVWT